GVYYFSLFKNGPGSVSYSLEVATTDLAALKTGSGDAGLSTVAIVFIVISVLVVVGLIVGLAVYRRHNLQLSTKSIYGRRSSDVERAYRAPASSSTATLTQQAGPRSTMDQIEAPPRPPPRAAVASMRYDAPPVPPAPPKPPAPGPNRLARAWPPPAASPSPS